MSVLNYTPLKPSKWVTTFGPLTLYEEAKDVKCNTFVMLTYVGPPKIKAFNVQIKDYKFTTYHHNKSHCSLVTLRMGTHLIEKRYLKPYFLFIRLENIRQYLTSSSMPIRTEYKTELSIWLTRKTVVTLTVTLFNMLTLMREYSWAEFL